MFRNQSFRDERTEEEVIAKFAHKLGFSKPRVCGCAEEVCDYLEQLYDESCAQLRSAYKHFVEGEVVDYSKSAIRPDLRPTGTAATYPFIGIKVDVVDLERQRGSYAAYALFRERGYYGATITAPRLFRRYLTEQLSLLFERYEVPVVVGLSQVPIPLPYVSNYQPSAVTSRPSWELHARFAMPDLCRVDDALPNGTAASNMAGVAAHLLPLSLFTAERVDFSLQRLAHYTGTSCEHFQGFILLTNYNMYVDQFVAWGQQQVLQHSGAQPQQPANGAEAPASPPQQQAQHQGGRGASTSSASSAPTGPPWEAGFTKLIGPHDTVLADRASGTLSALDASQGLPQMPAYHLVREDGLGVTMVNIGVGPSNAKTITDHLAVLRPHLFLMLGHCAGLRMSQRLGDYVLAHAYVREDHVLDQDLPLSVPLPPIAEVQTALEAAVAKVLAPEGGDVKAFMRTGTLVTTDNRDWELRAGELKGRFKQSRACAVDMESATIAANGFRFRVPYGTLLCISDKPIHGEIKLAGMANTFYKQRVGQHLQIGLEAVRILHSQGVERLQTRKMRGFDEPPFR